MVAFSFGVRHVLMQGWVVVSVIVIGTGIVISIVIVLVSTIVIGIGVKMVIVGIINIDIGDRFRFSEAEHFPQAYPLRVRSRAER